MRKPASKAQIAVDQATASVRAEFPIMPTGTPIEPQPELAPIEPPLRIDQAGIYELTAAQYHADPVIIPSLSRSILKRLVNNSPAHARSAHPRYGGEGEDDEPEAAAPDAKEDRDVGTVAHAMFLRGQTVVEKVDFATYQSKAAKAQRDEILKAGKVPLKAIKYDETMRLVEALERFRARTGMFTKGKPEQTLIWREGPTWCRAMVDWLYDDPAMPLDDLKTTPGSALSRTWSRNAFENGAHLQAVFYPRGVAELRDGEVPDGMRFVVAETKAPFGIKIFAMGEPAIAMAVEQMRYGMGLWERCQAEDRWPNYDHEVEFIDPPVWIAREWDWSSRSHVAERRAVDPALVNRMIAAGNLGG
jgi:PDDEXK-like domain of unknown function (DUF3799)